MSEIFRSSEMAVRTVGGFASAACVITFSPYSDERTLDRPGFGEAFFRDRSIDAVHVISRENDWYQYPETPIMAAQVAELVSRYERVVAYGSSMGGYAAIRFGGLAGASAALAISPQFSVDRQTAPSEVRWKRDSERIDFSLERTLKAPFVETSCIVYDPEDADQRQVDMYRGHTRVVDVRLATVGHPAIGAIAGANLLSDLVIGVVENRLDPDDFVRRMAQQHQGTAAFHFVMSTRAEAECDRIAHAALAAQMSPGHLGYVLGHASLLAAAGSFDEAEAGFAAASAIAPGHPVLIQRLITFHQQRGDLETALELARSLVQRHSERFQPLLDDLEKQWRSRQRRKRLARLVFGERGESAVGGRTIR